MPNGRGGTIATVTGGARFLRPGIHVAFIIVDHPGDVVVLTQGIVEGTVADIVDSPVTSEYYDLTQHITKAVEIGLIQTEFSSQSCGRGGAEAVVTRLVNPVVEGIGQL